jgi:hypothetical protein
MRSVLVAEFEERLTTLVKCDRCDRDRCDKCRDCWLAGEERFSVDDVSCSCGCWSGGAYLIQLGYDLGQTRRCVTLRNMDPRVRTLMGVSVRTRDALAKVAVDEFGAVSLDEALQVVLFEHWTLTALSRLAAEPDGLEEYRAEADHVAEVTGTGTGIGER